MFSILSLLVAVLIGIGIWIGLQGDRLSPNGSTDVDYEAALDAARQLQQVASSSTGGRVR